MANTKSALKRIRQTATRTARNRAVTSKLKTLRKKVAAAVETSDKEAAAAAYNTFSSAVDKAAKVGTIPANRAANYKSKAAKAGFEFADISGALDKLDEEMTASIRTSFVASAVSSMTSARHQSDGSPASCRISTKRWHDSGVSPAGLTMAGQPAASAGPNP